MQVNWPVLFKRPAEPPVPQVSDKLQFVASQSDISDLKSEIKLFANVYFFDKRHTIDLMQRRNPGEHFLQGRLAQAF